jgi:hypothetical protein
VARNIARALEDTGQALSGLAVGVYERPGFRAQGPVHDDAGIPHWDRVRAV